METPERHVANEVLRLSASAVSAPLDRFTNWTLIGSGAALALVVSNLRELKGYISTEHVQWAAYLYVLAAIAAAIQKYLAVMVSASLSVAARLEERMNALPDADISGVMEIIEQTAPWPWHLLIRRGMRRNEDFGRIVFRRALAQSTMAGIAIALIAASLFALVSGM